MDSFASWSNKKKEEEEQAKVKEREALASKPSFSDWSNERSGVTVETQKDTTSKKTKKDKKITTTFDESNLEDSLIEQKKYDTKTKSKADKLESRWEKGKKDSENKFTKNLKQAKKLYEEAQKNTYGPMPTTDYSPEMSMDMRRSVYGATSPEERSALLQGWIQSGEITPNEARSIANITPATAYEDYYNTAKENAAARKEEKQRAAEAKAAEDMARWQSLTQNPDYDKNSKYVSTYNGNEVFNATLGTFTETGYDDILYDYVNGDQKAQDRVDNVIDINGRGMGGGAYTTTHEGWKNLPQEVVGLFNYLYKTEGPDSAYEFLNAVTDKGRTGVEDITLGFLEGLGTTSAAAALGEGLEAVGVGNGSDEWYRQYKGEVAKAAKEAPGLFSAGQVGGNLALLGIAGAGAGAAVGKIASLGAFAKHAATNALTFALSGAVHNVGAAATGMTSWGDFAKAASVDTIRGAVSGMAGWLVGSGLADVLRSTKLSYQFSEFVRSIAASTVSATSNVGTGYLLSENKPSARQLATEFVTAFLFAGLQGAVNAYKTVGIYNERMDAAIKAIGEEYKNLGNLNPEQLAAARDNILEQTNNLRAAVNENYLPGQQSKINDINAFCDAVEASLNPRLGEATTSLVPASPSSDYASQAIQSLQGGATVTPSYPPLQLTPTQTVEANALTDALSTAIMDGINESVGAVPSSQSVIPMGEGAAPQNLAPQTPTVPQPTYPAQPYTPATEDIQAAMTPAEDRRLKLPTVETQTENKGLQSVEPSGTLETQEEAPSAAILAPQKNAAEPRTGAETIAESKKLQLPTVKENNNVRGENDLRYGGERNNGSYSGEQVQGVGEEAGGIQARETLGIAADSGLSEKSFERKAVSTRELVGTGSEDDELYICDKNATEHTKAAAAVADEAGINLVLFGGDYMQIDGVTARGLYDPATNTMYVRADDPDFYSDQIARHEGGESAILDGSIDPDELLDTVRGKIVDTKTLDWIVGKYRYKYNGTTDPIERTAQAYADAFAGVVSDDEIWRQIICDSLGDMNIFASSRGTPKAERQRISSALSEIGSLAREMKSRAPPKTPAERAKIAQAKDLSPDFKEVKFSVVPPYRSGTADYDGFVESLDKEARKTYNVFADIHNYGSQNKVSIDGSSKDITQLYMTASKWNALCESNGAFASAAADLANLLPENVRRAAMVNKDGRISETPFEEEFKMERAFIQRIIDSLPTEVAKSTYTTNGKEVRVARGSKVESVGGENYRRALVEERRALYKAGKLPTKSIAGLSKDNWGAMGFLATNGKTGASGDFTTLCPQMYFNKGCFYCYRRSALTSGVNNKLVGENVWYTGEILQLKPEDIENLNKNGGLRIQSFGDWMGKYSTQLADLLIDAELVGLQIKIITKEPSMIDTVALLKEQGLGKNLYFNLSADYVIEKQGEINNQDTSGALPRNPARPFMNKDGNTHWKRALTVEEADQFRQRYPWVNTRIVATTIDEFLEGLRSPMVDVVTGYHGNIRQFERVSSATGETLLQVEPLGDAGMPRFSFDGKSWKLEYEGKTSTHKALAKAIEDAGLQFQYYIKSCCITGRCATCEGKCGKLARDFNVKNATNADRQSVAYWQKHMTSAEDNPLLLDQMADEQAKALLNAELARDGNEAPVSQSISSAKTSIKQIPALFNNKNAEFGKTNIDIGGGRFDLATDYLKSIGTKNLVFDPYNRSEEVNAATLKYLQDGNKADTATCANVLNVIKEAAARENVILETAKAIKNDGKAYFMVYEGDGSGVGRETSAGWQNNRKTADYVDEIGEYFDSVERKGKLIIASNPKADLPQAAWETSPGNAIRYSRESEEELVKINNDLRKRLNDMKRVAEKAQKGELYWKGQTKKTTKPTISEADATKLADRLVKDYSSKLKAADISQDLKEYGEYLRSGALDDDFVDVGDRAADIARKIVDSAIDDTPIANDVRDYLKGTTLHLPAEYKADMDDYGEFKKSNPSIKVSTQSGTDIEEAYNDLARMLGEDMFPDDITSPADQLQRIADVVQSLDTFYNDPYDPRKADAIDFISADILDSLLDLPEAPPTIMDKADAKRVAQVRKAVEYGQQRVAEVREQKNQRIEEIRQYYRDRDARRREARQLSHDRNQVLKLSRRLANAKLPAGHPKLGELRDKLIGNLYLGAQTLTERKKTKLTELQDEMEAQKKELGVDFIAAKGKLEQIENLNKKSVSELTNEELLNLTDALLNFEYTLKTYNKFVNSVEKRDTYEAGMAVIRDVKAKKGLPVMGNQRPYSAALRMVGYNEDNPLPRLVWEVEKGQLKANKFSTDAMEPFQPFINDKKYMSSSSGPKAKSLKITGRDITTGEIVQQELTPMMLVELFCAQRNDDNMRHMQDGFVTFPNMKWYRRGKLDKAYDGPNTTRLSLKRSNILEAAKQLTPRDYQFISALDNYYNVYAPDMMNPVSAAVDGVELFRINPYYHISSNKNFLRGDYDSFGVTDSNGTIDVAHPGWTKERVNATNGIVLRDANSTLLQQIQANAKYYGLALPMQNLAKILNVTGIGQQESVRNALGNRNMDYLIKYMKDVAGVSSRDDTRMAKWFDKRLSKYAGGVLGMGLATAAIQFPSYFLTAAEVGWKPVLRALFPSKTGAGRIVDERTATHKVRKMGLSTPELGAIAKQKMHVPAIFKPIQVVDVGTTALIKRVAYYAAKRENPNLSVDSEEFKQNVADTYDKLIVLTQPIYDAAHRPEVLRSTNDIVRSVAMFMTQPLQTANVIMDAFANRNAKRRAWRNTGTEEAKQKYQKSKERTAWATSAAFVSTLLISITKSLRAMVRGKDKAFRDKEGKLTLGSWAKGVGVGMLTSTAGMSVFGKSMTELGMTLADTIAKGTGGDEIFGQGFYGVEAAALASLTDAGNALLNVTKTITSVAKAAAEDKDIDWEDATRKLIKASGDIGLIFGVPAKNIVADVKAAVRGAIVAYGATNGNEVKAEYQAMRLLDASDKEYYDKLYDYYKNDREKFREFYNLMLDDEFMGGKNFTADKIKSAMEDRMKADEGVRFMDYDTQKKYDKVLKDATGSKLWKSTRGTVKNSVKQFAYDYVTGEETKMDKINDHPNTDISYKDYINVLLNLDEADKAPLYSYKQEEITEALENVTGLSQTEKYWVWQIISNADSDANNPYREEGSEVRHTKTEEKEQKAAEEAKQKERDKVEEIDVEDSDVIKFISYNEKTATLTVKMVGSGKTYTYYNVPKSVWRGFKSAKSMGNYYNTNIKNNEDYKQKS